MTNAIAGRYAESYFLQHAFYLLHLYMDPCVCVSQIGVAFYEMLQAVDQHCQHLSYMDPICDFLYHIKYMYTGDSVKEQVRRLFIKAGS